METRVFDGFNGYSGRYFYLRSFINPMTNEGGYLKISNFYIYYASKLDPEMESGIVSNIDLGNFFLHIKITHFLLFKIERIELHQ